MSNNHDYHFPSGELRYPDLTEFEKKHFRRENKQWKDVMIALSILLGLLFMTFLTWIYYKVPTIDTAHAAEVEMSRADSEFLTFCEMAVRDHKQLHEKLTGNLKEVCGNYE